jgi:hypothetical protein
LIELTFPRSLCYLLFSYLSLSLQLSAICVCKFLSYLLTCDFLLISSFTLQKCSRTFENILRGGVLKCVHLKPWSTGLCCTFKLASVVSSLSGLQSIVWIIFIFLIHFISFFLLIKLHTCICTIHISLLTIISMFKLKTSRFTFKWEWKLIVLNVVFSIINFEKGKFG